MYTNFVFNLANIKVLSEIDFAHTRNFIEPRATIWEESNISQL